MSNQKKDLFDTIDDYFSQINADEIAEKISKGVNSFSKTISDSFDAYSNSNKPEFSRFLKEYSSRLEYVQEELTNNNPTRIKGSKIGYQQAIDDIQKLIQSNPNDLNACNQRIHQLIKEIRLRASHYKKSYVDGYINGCQYASKVIKRSASIMMDKIMNEVMKKEQ